MNNSQEPRLGMPSAALLNVHYAALAISEGLKTIDNMRVFATKDEALTVLANAERAVRAGIRYMREAARRIEELNYVQD